MKKYLIVLPATLLLGISLWILRFHYPLEEFCRLGLPRNLLVIRQAVTGLAAILLAVVIGRCSLHRHFLKRWYVFPALFGLVFLSVPISLLTGIDRVIMGTYWWQRSIGIITAHLALIGGLCYTLPRFAENRENSTCLMTGISIFSLTVPLLFLNRMAEFTVFWGILLFVPPVVLRGKRLVTVWILVLVTFPAALFPVLFSSSSRMARVMAFLDPEKYAQNEAWQLLQSLTSIYAGGWTGCTEYPPFIPEWKTGFIFGKLCGAGGAVAGLVVLFLLAALLFCAWQIALRQTGMAERVLAAACASILTLYPIGHVCINLGLVPTKEYLFPFLSYGRYFMLFCGLLLGLLISLGREKAGETDADASSRLPWVMPVLGALLLITCAVRLISLVVHPPSPIPGMREQRIQRIGERLAEKNKPERGQILDRNGKVLAQNSTNYILCADPHALMESPETHLLSEVARLAKLDESVVMERIEDRNRRYVRLRQHLPPTTAEAIRRMSVYGIFIDEAPDRSYPQQTPLAHLVGIAQVREQELIGAGGIEMVHNSSLTAGNDVQLTLDTDLQAVVQQIAEFAIKKTKAKKAQIIVMNPRSGAIRAAAQVPAIHGADPIQSEEERWALNWRAVIDIHEPGGLIKPLVMAAALDGGTFLTNSLIDCENGRWLYNGRFLHDSHSNAQLTPEEILIKSSNIGMAKVGLEMGEQPLYDALHKWQLPEKCSAGGFGGASRGILYPIRHWSKISVTRIPIGHECASSLLQILRAYTAFFNEGKMIEPYLVAPVSEPVHVINPETARTVRGMLRKVVTEGTGKKAQVEGMHVWGKTAVVQKIRLHGDGYSRNKFQTSFLGGFEVGGTPWMIAVWLDEPDRKESFNPAPEIFQCVAKKIISF